MAEDGRLRENNVAGEFRVDTLMSLRCSRWLQYSCSH